MSHQHTAAMLRETLKSYSGVSEQKMFGGICFLLDGNMLCGSGDGRFMFRVGKDLHDEALTRPGAEPMILGGRNMGGLVWVDQEAALKAGLDSWIEFAKRYVGALPAKSHGSLPLTVPRRRSR